MRARLRAAGIWPRQRARAQPPGSPRARACPVLYRCCFYHKVATDSSLVSDGPIDSMAPASLVPDRPIGQVTTTACYETVLSGGRAPLPVLPGMARPPAPDGAAGSVARPGPVS